VEDELLDETLGFPIEEESEGEDSSVNDNDGVEI
jgi:hypothetical protein